MLRWGHSYHEHKHVFHAFFISSDQRLASEQDSCIICFSMQSVAMAERLQVHMWLKSLSPTMKLERLSPQFETRGFRSRRSLAFVKTEDLDSFFPSPGKLLLAERRILESELNNIKAENHQQPTRPEPKLLNLVPSASTAEKPTRETPQPCLPETAADTTGLAIVPNQSPMDRRALEMAENLKVLKVQVESAENWWMIFIRYSVT